MGVGVRKALCLFSLCIVVSGRGGGVMGVGVGLVSGEWWMTRQHILVRDVDQLLGSRESRLQIDLRQVLRGRPSIGGVCDPGWNLIIVVVFVCGLDFFFVFV